MKGLLRSHWLLLASVLGFLLIGLLSSNPFKTANQTLYTAQVEGNTSNVPQGVENYAAFGQKNGKMVGFTPKRGWVALTFDDGPDATWTPQVQAVLDKHGVKATFFELGDNVIQHPLVTKNLYKDGNEIGLHTFTHPNLSVASKQRTDTEMAADRAAVEAVTGHVPTFMRPPFSSGSDALDNADWNALQTVTKNGYVAVLTTTDTKDWQKTDPTALLTAMKTAKKNNMAGQIILMHDGGGNRADTVKELDELLTQVQADGWKVGTVSQVLDMQNTDLPTTQKDRLVDIAAMAGLGTATWTVRIASLLVLGAGGIAVLRAILLLAASRRHQRLMKFRNAKAALVTGEVTIVVPAYNEELGIEATIASLAKSIHPVRVIVVDDGSTDKTAELARAMAAKVSIPVEVITQPNAGKAAALNTGLKATKTDIVVMVDGDTVFEPDTVSKLVESFVVSQVGAVSGNAKVSNRKGILGHWQHIEYVIGFNLDRRMYDLATCMPTVPGAIGAFRTEALRQVGGLATDTLAEDTDLTMSLGRAGWLVRYAPEAIAWTEAPVTLKSLWKQRYRWSYGTMQAMWKHKNGLFRNQPHNNELFGTEHDQHYTRRALAYMTLFQVLFPLMAPMVDLFSIYGIFALSWTHIAFVWLFFFTIDLILAVSAFRADHESMKPLWALPLTQFVYRQLMYLVVIHSLATAIQGKRLAWQRMERVGANNTTENV